MTAALALKGPLRPPGAVRTTGHAWRHNAYTEALGERICEAIAKGLTMRQIRRVNQRRPGTWPAPFTIYAWAAEFPAFAERLAHANRCRAAEYAEAPLAILDAVDPDSPFGGHRVAKAREQGGHLRWMAEKLHPDAWGQRVQHDVQGVVAVVTLPLDLMLPAATAATNDGRNVHDPRVLELRALAAARRPVEGK